MYGAETCGSKLNRDALERVSRLLGKLLTAVLLVIIVADEDWGLLCYPPLEPGPSLAESTALRPLKPR